MAIYTVDEIIEGLTLIRGIEQTAMAVDLTLAAGQTLTVYYAVPSGFVRIPYRKTWWEWGDDSVEMTWWADSQETSKIMTPAHRMPPAPGAVPIAFFVKRTQTIIRLINYDTVNAADMHVTGIVYDLEAKDWDEYFYPLLRGNLREEGVKEVV